MPSLFDLGPPPSKKPKKTFGGVEPLKLAQFAQGPTINATVKTQSTKPSPAAYAQMLRDGLPALESQIRQMESAGQDSKDLRKRLAVVYSAIKASDEAAAQRAVGASPVDALNIRR
jgi:hypothetical protein